MKEFKISPAGEDNFKISIREKGEKGSLFFHLTKKEMDSMTFLMESFLQNLERGGEEKPLPEPKGPIPGWDILDEGQEDTDVPDGPCSICGRPAVLGFCYCAVCNDCGDDFRVVHQCSCGKTRENLLEKKDSIPPKLCPTCGSETIQGMCYCSVEEWDPKQGMPEEISPEDDTGTESYGCCPF